MNHFSQRVTFIIVISNSKAMNYFSQTEIIEEETTTSRKPTTYREVIVIVAPTPPS